MKCKRLLLLTCLLLLLFSPLLWSAPAKLALVIGNAAYKNETPLTNTLNDARDLAGKLQTLGFEVTRIENAARRTLSRAVNDFVRKVQGTDAVALIYYSGHGLQVNGQNYLLPVDARIEDELDVPVEGLALNRILAGLGNRGDEAVNLIVLDACRNNPYKRDGSRSVGNKGLARVRAPGGTLILYAARPGETASDNTQGRNGLFTKHLLKAMGEPGVAVEQSFKQVALSVLRESNRKQSPWQEGVLYGDFFFLPPSARRPAPVVKPGPAPKLKGTVVASGKADMDGDGREDRVALVMTRGKRYDDAELWAGMGKKYEGNFIVRIAFGDGSLAETDLNAIFSNEDPLFFWDRPWTIQFNDYNRDGRPDFNLGVYASSNGFTYKLFTLDAVRSVSEMRFSDRDGLFITDQANSTTKIPVGPDGIVFERYDNTVGRMVKQIFRWNAAEDQFVTLNR